MLSSSSPPSPNPTTSTTATILEDNNQDEPQNNSHYSLHLLTLLLNCAEFISSGDISSAQHLLPEIFELSSPFGCPPDRVTSFFAHSLHSRILSSSLNPHPPSISPHLHSLTLISQLRGFHSALQAYNSITPFVKFSHFTSNQAIYEALDGEDHVHVIDLDIMQGLQWPGLFHILASRPRKMGSVRVTGFGPCSELLAQTGRRLGEFAQSLGLPFEFNSVEGKIGNLRDLSRLGVRPGDVTVVHCMHHSLYDITGSDGGTLRVLGAVRPRLVTMVEQDMNINVSVSMDDVGGGGGMMTSSAVETGSFLGRFVEALHYYSAMFDALGEGLGRDSVQRHQVEQQLFGSEIKNILALGGPKRRRGISSLMMDGGDEVGRWAHELKRVGFEPFSLAGSPAAQASLLLGMFPWRGYTLVEENGCLRLGWKDLPLLTASAWQPSEFIDSSANI